MSKETIDFAELKFGAHSFKDFLDACGHEPGLDLSVVYLKDSDGNLFGKVFLEQETLTDGSKVYNLILYKDRG